MKARILVVEDEPLIAKLCRRVLEAAGATVLLAGGAKEGAALAESAAPDAALVDVQLPDGNGMELCRRLRANPKTASLALLLMSGARTGVGDQAEGIEGGADDYIVKPFDARLLCAKVEALLRRVPPEPRVIKTGGVELDLDARLLRVRGEKVATTRKEFDLLAAVLAKPERVLSVASLLEAVWGVDPAESNDPRTVKVHVSSLRKKLGPEGRRLVNVPGHGYRWDP